MAPFAASAAAVAAPSPEAAPVTSAAEPAMSMELLVRTCGPPPGRLMGGLLLPFPDAGRRAPDARLPAPGSGSQLLAPGSGLRHPGSWPRVSRRGRAKARAGRPHTGRAPAGPRQAAVRPRLMTSRWIWLVPSKICMIFASRM
ncbi:hypothetical protein GCM10017752_14140 [Streptomyces roseoviridis]